MNNEIFAINTVDYTYTTDTTDGTVSVPFGDSGFWDNTVIVSSWSTEPAFAEDEARSGFSQITGITKHEEVFEMQVYDVVVVDTKECAVLLRQNVIAEDEKAAYHRHAGERIPLHR